jgi:hypothetical protein
MIIISNKFFLSLNFLNIQIFYLNSVITFFYYFYLNNFFSLSSFFFFQKQLILNNKKNINLKKFKFNTNFFFNYFRLIKKNQISQKNTKYNFKNFNAKVCFNIKKFKSFNLLNKYLLFKKFLLIEYTYFYTFKTILSVFLYFNYFISYFCYTKLLFTTIKFLYKTHKINISQFSLISKSSYLNERMIFLSNNLNNFNNKSYSIFSSQQFDSLITSNDEKLKLMYLMNNFFANNNLFHVNYFFLLIFSKNTIVSNYLNLKKNFSIFSLLTDFDLKKKISR